MEKIELQQIGLDFTVCKIKNISSVDFTREFVFLSKTEDELSLVCESTYVPTDAIAWEAGWKGLKIVGMLDFGMIGVIAKISNLLAAAEISIFVVSTYNTDYILLKATHIEKAIQLLEQEGYKIL